MVHLIVYLNGLPSFISTSILIPIFESITCKTQCTRDDLEFIKFDMTTIYRQDNTSPVLIQQKKIVNGR